MTKYYPANTKAFDVMASQYGEPKVTPRMGEEKPSLVGLTANEINK